MPSLNLHEAARQWATRPDDQRFWTIEDLAAYVHDRRVRSRQTSIPLPAITFSTDAEAAPGEVILEGPSGGRALLTNYAFGQMCRTFRAPSGFLANLPPENAAADLNYMIKATPPADLARDRDFLFLTEDPTHNGMTTAHPDTPSLRLRSYASDRYGRIWDQEIVSWLDKNRRAGWRVPPARPSPTSTFSRPATEADLLPLAGNAGAGLSINLGDLIAPAGLYAGDRDMFAFQVDETKPIEVGSETLFRGFFIWNSEVAGAASFGLMTFLFRAVCGNHIVWGAEEVRKFSTRHIGDAYSRAMALGGKVLDYLDTGTEAETSMITGAISREIGKDRPEVIAATRKITGTSQTIAESAYQLAEEVEHLNPRSRWGIVQGMTRIAGGEANADARSQIERQAEQLLYF